MKQDLSNSSINCVREIKHSDGSVTFYYDIFDRNDNNIAINIAKKGKDIIFTEAGGLFDDIEFPSSSQNNDPFLHEYTKEAIIHEELCQLIQDKISRANCELHTDSKDNITIKKVSSKKTYNEDLSFFAFLLIYLDSIIAKSQKKFASVGD